MSTMDDLFSRCCLADPWLLHFRPQNSRIYFDSGHVVPSRHVHVSSHTHVEVQYDQAHHTLAE